jgi:hypothetical protein
MRAGPFLLAISFGANVALVLALVALAGVGLWYVREVERDWATVQNQPAEIRRQIDDVRTKVAAERERRRSQLSDCIRRQGSALRCRKWIGI